MVSVRLGMICTYRIYTSACELCHWSHVVEDSNKGQAFTNGRNTSPTVVYVVTGVKAPSVEFLTSTMVYWWFLGPYDK